MSNPKRILVTGATGKVGQAFIRHLNPVPVAAPSRPGVEGAF